MLGLNQVLTDLMCISNHDFPKGGNGPQKNEAISDLKGNIDAYLADLFQFKNVIGKYPMNE